jgi:two-component system chemotaxis response regulator CheY
MKILLIEKEPKIAEALVKLLAKWNMETVPAQDSAQALAALYETSFDMLIADLPLSEAATVELVVQVREAQQFNGLPILAVSGMAQKEDILAASQAGVNGFLAKPFKADQLKKKIIEVHGSFQRLLLRGNLSQLWEDRTTYKDNITSPHILFGEAINSLDELMAPPNNAVAQCLATGWRAVQKSNQLQVGLNAGYMIESQTTNIVMFLKKEASKAWLKALLISSKCHGNPVVIARMMRINKGATLPIYLILEDNNQIPPAHREGLKKIGLKVVRPQAVRGRIVQDVETMATLPALPKVFEKISAMARDPKSDLKDWIEVIKLDPMSSATLLKHANSASLGLSTEVSQVERAVVLLGKRTVAGLIASEAMRKTFTSIQEVGFDLEDFWLHNLCVGFTAHVLSLPVEASSEAGTAELATLGLDQPTMDLLKQINLATRLRLDPTQAGAFVAGSMHDIGKGVMVNSYPGLFPLLLDEMRSQQWSTSMLHAEQEVAGGLTHTVTGEILIRKWGLGEQLGNVVLSHHQPSFDDSLTFLVGVADVFGQALYPFPKSSAFPVAAAVEANELRTVTGFLPAGFLEQPLLSVDELTALIKALGPRIKRFVEDARKSVS